MDSHSKRRLAVFFSFILCRFTTMKFLISFLTFFLCLTICQSQRLKAPTLSPFCKVSQEVGLTEIHIEYSRPSAKGRIVFGGLVPFGRIWRTGANASTKITLLESAKIGGQSIKAGTYALYTIPRKNEWTIIVHSNLQMRSLAGNAYDPKKDILRFRVKPKVIPVYVETFTIQYSELTANSTNLEFTWENTSVAVPLEFEVDDKIERQIAEFKKNPASTSHRSYFEAAQYYSNNGGDLNEALDFINKALYKSPENFRYGLLKSKIQAKNEDFKGALISVKTANQWAKNKKNANYIEQTELFWKSLLTEK